jgi:hypothetical protein
MLMLPPIRKTHSATVRSDAKLETVSAKYASKIATGRIPISTEDQLVKYTAVLSAILAP